MKRTALLAALGLVFATLPAQALGLLEAYQAAQQNDPIYLAAVSAHTAGQKHRDLAMAGLLPQIHGSLYRSTTRGVREYPISTRRNARIMQDQLHYDSKNYAVQIRQSLFDWRKISEFRQGKARTQHSDATFAHQRNELGMRVARAYFEALLAQHNIELLEARVRAYDEQHTRANRLYRSGEGTITDIDEALARRDLAVAQRFEAEDRLKISLRALADITGHTLTTQLNPLSAIPLTPPTPNHLDEWLDIARTHSPEIQAAEASLAIADRELDKARAGHFPSVELVGHASKTVSDSLSTLNQETWSRSAGVQVTIPIFNGGYHSTLSAQQAARREQARHELHATRNQVEIAITTAFTGTLSGVSKVRGYEQAVKSSEAALRSTRMGFQAGLRTNADILNAEEQLFIARRDLAEARFQYLTHALKLRASAGILIEEDIVRLDAFLSKKQAKK